MVFKGCLLFNGWYVVVFDEALIGFGINWVKKWIQDKVCLVDI